MRLIAFIILLLTCTRAGAADSLIINRISPLPVNEKGQQVYNLGGNWLFHPAPPVGFEKKTTEDASWKKIEVPGEWAMQGFKVEKNNWAGYTRSFSIPAEWKDKRIKLRCDGIYSQCEVFINGEKVAAHLGGFTVFETDITHLVNPDQPAVITIRVKNESVADSLASGSKYAVHPLGGITRKIQLIALPEVNIGQLQVLTSFDKNYKDATLTTEMRIRNESRSNSSIALLFELFSPINQEKVFSKEIPVTGQVFAGEQIERKFDFAINDPIKWDGEHPHLYRLKTTLLRNGKQEEVVEKNVGFRQIEVRGNRLYVNNFPVKLRGVCRHEVMPLRGRSVNGNQWEEDVKILRDGNVNYIRTSHYPPAEELVDACDRLGMFLEVEAPFCWAHQTNVSAEQFIPALQTQTLDMVEFFRSHPSVLIWSVGNESMKYKEYFKRTAAIVKQLDPSRPRNFSQWGPDADDNELEIGNHHYPGPDGPAKYADAKRPMVFDEYCHLNAYNRFELITDPGIRDAWGIGMAAMWENMYNTPAILGGALWAGIDDTFILRDSAAVGYGTWGPIDGWRRTKPEYWHMKKAYSPVKITLVGNYKDDTVHISIENRLLFSNISECKIQWHAGKYNAVIHPSIAQSQKQIVAIKINGRLTATDTLFIDVYDPRDVLIDQYAFAIVAEVKEQIKQQEVPAPTIKYIKTENSITARAAALQIILDKPTGNIEVSKAASNTPIAQLAKLMLLPLNGEGRGIQMTGEAQVFDPFTSTASNRIIKKIEYSCLRSKFVVTIYDDYDEASGYIVYEFIGDKNINIHYRYTANKDINPRQWGMVVSLANDFNTISWKRKGLWNYYPADDIGRLSGMANAISSEPISGPAGPVQKPALPWSQDRTELGTNDFRSTKMYITNASVQGANTLLNVTADGKQSIRIWKQNEETKFLIAGYSNLGSEGFFRGHAERFDKPLKQGDVIEDTINLEVK